MSGVELGMVGDRCSEFEEIGSEGFKGLKGVFGRKNEVVIVKWE
ncbi:hypothetical protein [Staphylococcus epidermidis]|nr:hypothetical protein [Staphylococcus epidermidis]